MKRQIQHSTKTAKLTRRQIRDTLEYIHVVPETEGWSVRKSGDLQTDKLFDEKQKATAYAFRKGADSKTNVIVHARSGKIEIVDTSKIQTGSQPSGTGGRVVRGRSAAAKSATKESAKKKK